MKDLLGKDIAIGDYVLTCQNNRIVIAKIAKIDNTWLTVKPIESNAGDRRSVPPQKPLRKLGYNVSKIDDPEITFGMLRGAI
jgi:hypothetical protein